MANVYGLSTTDKKYGTGSFYTPNNSTRTKSLLITPTSGDFSIDTNQDFIISVWVNYGSINVSTLGASYPIIQYGGLNGQFWGLGVYIQNIGGYNPTPYFQYGTTKITATFNGSNGDTISPSGWSNWLVQRTNGVITFTNDTNTKNITTANFTGSIGKNQATGAGLYVGATNPGATTGINPGAYVDELFFARGTSTVERRNPTTGAINDGTLATTVFLYQFDGNYYDDETGTQLFSAAISDTSSSMSATLSKVLSLKTAQAAITTRSILVGDITSITGTQRFTSTPNSQFSLSATLTKTYRISPTIVDNAGGYYLDNISLDSTVKKFGQQSLKIGGITTYPTIPSVLCAGAANEWLALGNDGNSGTVYAWYSSDNGATWSRRTPTGLSGITSLSTVNLKYLNGRFVFGYGTSIYASTTNGSSWTAYTPTVSGYVALTENIHYANGLWIILFGWYGTGVVYIYTSTDLTTWTRRNNVLSVSGYLNGSLSVDGIASSGTTVKIVVSCTDSSTSNSRYELWTSTNSTTWTREILITTPAQGSLSKIESDGANNWIANFSIYGTPSTSEVYTKAGAGAWTRKTAGLGVITNVFYFNSKWYVYNQGDGNWYSSTDLGTTWTLAFRENLTYNKSSTTLAGISISATNNRDPKFVSTQDVATWTISSFSDLINIPETVTYTATDNRYTTWKTLDFWIYLDPNGLSGQSQYIMGQGSGYNPNYDSNWSVLAQMSGATNFSLNFSGTGAGSSLTVSAWHHVRIVKDGLNMAAFVDGTRRSTWTLARDWDYNPGPFILGGRVSTNINLYLDEVLLSKDILTPTTSTTYTTPTTAWTSTASANLLLHFDNSLLDDNNLPLAGYLGSYFSMNTLAGKSIVSTAALISTTTVQASARKLKEITLSRQAAATMTVNAIAVKRSTIALFTNLDITVDETKFKRTSAILTATSNADIAAAKTVKANTHFDSIVSLALVNIKKLTGLVDITAVSTLSITPNITKPFTVSLISSTDLATNSGKLVGITANLTTNVSSSVTADKFKRISANLTSSSTLSTSASRNRQFATRLVSRFTLVAKPFEPAKSFMVANTSMAVTIGKITKTQANLAAKVRWSFIYDRNQPLSSDALTWTIQKETTVYVIPKEYRQWQIPNDVRTWTIEQEQTDWLIEPEVRAYIIKG
jgi:Concanavalin A-like lectin/glucanases superfamily